MPNQFARTVLIEALPPEWTAWSSLRPFLNTDWVARKLISKHNVAPKYHGFARKQAEQLKYSLMQAQEHWNAANLSTAATKPLHLYYCCMCLALAEVLWRGDGRASIDQLRATDNHHGLKFSTSLKNLQLSCLEELRIVPHVTNKGRSGTFEVWHQHTRENWLVGKKTDHRQNFFTYVDVIFHPSDKRLPLIPEVGIALKDLYAAHPRMSMALAAMGLRTSTVRATLELKIENSNRVGFQTKVSTLVNVHPTRRAAIQKLQDLMSFSPSTIEDLEIVELQNNFQIVHVSYQNEYGGTGNFQLPDGMAFGASTVYFAPWMPFLNEFGILYCGSYLLGMLCRYYPDLWMREIERNSEFAYLATEFMQVTAARIPLLCLSVLSNTVYLRNDVGVSI